MIKYYKNDNNEIRAVEQGQEFLVQEDWIEITLEELQELQKPTEEQILAGKIAEAREFIRANEGAING